MVHSSPSENLVDKPLLVGRDRELGELRRRLDEVQEGGSAVLVAGEAGIGKSSLLAAARAYALEHGFRVLMATGTETEAELPFAAVHQLIRPILYGASGLPDPQRRALFAAFGIEDGTTSELFLVAMATLSLIADHAAERPVLILAEDVHWFDRASIDVLGFLARRIADDPIVLVAAARDRSGVSIDDLDIEELRPLPLGDREAARVLERVAPELPAAFRRVVLEHAVGNPLALTELPHALVAEDLASPEAGAAVVPLTTRLEEAFAARVERLPPQTQALLLVAAADDRDEVGEIVRAGARLSPEGTGRAALGPAVDSGLVRLVDGRLAFRHPLVRSAIYQRAPADKRRAAHAALAAVLDGDLDRGIVHQAAASEGPDDEIADALERAAARAQDRGAPLSAADALRRAAAFTVDRRKRVDRLLAAADIAFEVGRPDQVERLIASAREGELTPLQQGRVEYLAEIFDDSRSGDPIRVRTLVTHARAAVELGEDALALRLLSGAALRSWWADPGQDVRVEVVAAAQALPVDPLDPVLLLTLGCADPIGQAGIVLERLARITDRDFERPSSHLYGLAAQAVGDPDAVIRFVTTSADSLRREGRLGLLTHALTVMGSAAAMAGEFQIARPALEEGLRLGRETEQPVWRAGPYANLAIVDAARGDHELSASFASQSEEIALPRRLSTILCCVQIAKGIDALAGARHDDAYRELVRVFTPGDVTFNMRHLAGAIGLFADAASYTGRQAEARTVMQGLGLFSLEQPPPALEMGLAYARAVLGLADGRNDLVEETLSRYTTGWSFDHARLLLSYGVWLRRQRRVADSREPLRAARDLFDQIGTVPWSRFARQELRAAGEGSPARSEAAWDRLTAQEVQIVRLAAEGLSNREIGARLYLSHRTVASHLYRAFPKLGITSRAQLHLALPPA